MPSNNFKNCLFLYVTNSRLEFNNSEKVVTDFVINRLKYHEVGDWEILPDWASMPNIGSELIAKCRPETKFVVLADILNPICDFELVTKMIETLQRTEDACCRSEGAIPGTGVVAVYSVDAIKAEPKQRCFPIETANVIQYSSQEIFNNQLNLYKFKRLKLFVKLISQFPNLWKSSIPEFINVLSDEPAFSMLISFGEDVRLEYHTDCPHCEGLLHSEPSSMSQPFCGYLPSSKPIYHKCEQCGLVVISPSIHRDDVHKIYDEWDKQDFVTSTNNPYVDEAIRCNLNHIIPHLPDVLSTLDLGGGIGNFSRYLKEKYPLWAVTHSDFEIKTDVVGDFEVRAIDFSRQAIGENIYNLITAWEVIEHVPVNDLDFILKNIWTALDENGYFIFSTPDFDSPLCKSFDFFAACPPFHYAVYGETWLRNYFQNSDLFDVVDVRHCSDFLDDAENWYSYGEETCPTSAMRAQSKILKQIFELDEGGKLRNELNKRGLGTEVIFTLKKKN